MPSAGKGQKVQDATGAHWVQGDVRLVHSGLLVPCGKCHPSGKQWKPGGCIRRGPGVGETLVRVSEQEAAK